MPNSKRAGEDACGPRRARPLVRELLLKGFHLVHHIDQVVATVRRFEQSDRGATLLPFAILARL